LSANVTFVVMIVAAAGPTWFAYQICSRKLKWLRYKLKRMIVGICVYLAAALVFLHQGLPTVEAVSMGVLVGLGGAWILVNAPKRGRRPPRTIRDQVIERDLSSKGLKWDSAKYHIDHIVPFSRGGDHSLRNLRVVEKRKNLRKGDRMPGVREFLRREEL
jgi:hypothetical protein